MILTRARVASLAPGASRITIEASATDTPAVLARSVNVGRRSGPADSTTTELPSSGRALTRTFQDRVKRISDAGFLVEIWDWTAKDIDALIDALAASGATIVSMTGYVRGN